MISFVWAEDNSGGIGLNGRLPWYLPADMNRFKELTIHHPMIMGYNTFKSLPHILPKRHHVILTHRILDELISNNKITLVHSKTELDSWINQHSQEKVSIIGGSSLFNLYASQVDVLYRTVIDADFKCDTFMPKIEYQKFELMQQKDFKADSINQYNYHFLDYKRKGEEYV